MIDYGTEICSSPAHARSLAAARNFKSAPAGGRISLSAVPLARSLVDFAREEQHTRDAQGKLTGHGSDDATAAGGIRMCVTTTMQAIVIKEMLRPQLEALYTPVFAAIPDAT